MQDLTTQLDAMRAIQKQCGFGYGTLRDLASAGLRLDRDLLDRMDAAIEAIHANILSRIDKGLYPGLPRDEIKALVKTHGLPIPVLDLAKSDHPLAAQINFFRDRPSLRLPEGNQQIDAKTIDLPEFDALMASAATVQDRAAILEGCATLFPEFQENRDLKMRDLIVLRDLLSGIADAIFAHAAVLLEAGSFPVFPAADLPEDCGLQQACAILGGAPDGDAIELVLREASRLLTFLQNAAIKVKPDDRTIFVSPGAFGSDRSPFFQAYAKVREVEKLHRKPRLDTLTATDVLDAQSPQMRVLIRNAEHRLIEKALAGEIPVVEIKTALRCSNDGTIYVPTNDPAANAPMLGQVFAHYMQLKHGIVASLIQADEQALVAMIEL